MKSILTLAIAAVMMLALSACNDKENASSSGGAAQQTTVASTTPANTTLAGTTQAVGSTTAANTPSGEVFDHKITLEGVPAEWQKGIGKAMYGMETKGDATYSAGYLQKFGNVTQADYDKLIAYYDTLSVTEKRDSVYTTSFGQVQVLYNADKQEITCTWWCNK